LALLRSLLTANCSGATIGWKMPWLGIDMESLRRQSGELQSDATKEVAACGQSSMMLLIARRRHAFCGDALAVAQKSSSATSRPWMTQTGGKRPWSCGGAIGRDGLKARPSPCPIPSPKAHPRSAGSPTGFFRAWLSRSARWSAWRILRTLGRLSAYAHGRFSGRVCGVTSKTGISHGLKPSSR
jgi:hypothetical protein